MSAPDPTILETDHPSDDEDVAWCPHCDRPFPEDASRDLHLGEAHEAVLTEEQRAAHESATAAEEDTLFYFHIKVVAILGILYAAVVLLYMAALGSGFL